MKKELLEKIGKLHEAEKYQEIIDLIEGLPDKQLDADLIGELGRAYNNVENYQKGLEILKSIETEEGDNALWNWRIGYSYYFLKDYINAKKHFLKAYELDPDDEDVCDFLIGVYLSLAKIEDEKGNSEKAIEYALESRRYVKNGQVEVDTESLIAWLYDKYMDYTKAEEILRSILAKNKEDEWVLSELGYCLSEQGKHEEALKFLQRLEKIGVDDSWTNTEYAYCLSKLNRYEEAIGKLNHALEVEDEEKETGYIYTQLGLCNRNLEKYEEAIEAFTQAKKWGRNDAWINDEIGHCYKKKGDMKKALEFYLIAEKENKKDPYLMSDIAWIYDGLGQYEEGLKYIKKAVKLGRDDAWLNEEYGACLAGLDRYEEAIEKYKYALNLDDEEKDEAYIYRQLGWCYRQLEDYEKALEYALIAYELDRDDIRSLSQVGWFYDYMGKYEEGLPFLLRAEELGRDDEWINTEIATNLGRSGKTSEGIERLHKSLAMVSEEDINQRIFINSEIAWNYGRLEEPHPEEALKYLNIAKELGREDEWIYSQIGYQLGYNLETRKEALEHFDKALELGQNDAWIFEMRGTILLDFKRYEEALDSFKKAYDLNDDSWYLYSMGECLRKLGRYQEAIEVLLESRQISIDEDDVVDGEDLELAHSYLGIGDKDNAQKYLDSARTSLIEQGTLNDEIKEEIEKIEKGILSLEN